MTSALPGRAHSLRHKSAGLSDGVGRWFTQGLDQQAATAAEHNSHVTLLGESCRTGWAAVAKAGSRPDSS